MMEICASELDVTEGEPYYYGMGLLTDNIRWLRERFRTQTLFAEAVDVTQPTVNRWLHGARPDHEALARLAALANVPVEIFTTVPAALFSGHRESPIPSVGELTEMLEGVLRELPTGLPYAEWPRSVAAALHTRLATLASDRAMQSTPLLPTRAENDEGDQPPPPTR
jgi:transcriptional regulator with XRE-family HTH domain